MRRGIGGRTVAEARRTLSHAELIEWAAYQRIVQDEHKRALKDKKQLLRW